MIHLLDCNKFQLHKSIQNNILEVLDGFGRMRWSKLVLDGAVFTWYLPVNTASRPKLANPACIRCKQLEHILTSQIMKHLNANNILYDLMISSMVLDQNYLVKPNL